MNILLVFLDGVGIGEDDPEANPFARAELPFLRQLLGGRIPTLEDLRVADGDHAVAFPLDATLGTPGLPQSGTGQTALLTGVDAPARFGRHFGPWVPVALRPLVEEESVLRHAVEAGRRVAFANAYPRDWPGPGRSRWPAAPPLAARAAGLMVRHEEALGRGDAIASGIVNDGWRDLLGHADLPDPTPTQVGRNLAAIAAGHDLTFYAHYATDAVGHDGDMEACVSALTLVDGFLAGVVGSLPPETLLLVTSDHGNIEDVRQQHTLNPCFSLLVGPDARGRSRDLTTIRHVAPAIEEWLSA